MILTDIPFCDASGVYYTLSPCRQRCVDDSLEGFQEHINDNNVHEEIQSTFDQSAREKNLNGSSGHQVQPGGGQRNADDVFHKRAACSPQLGDFRTIQDQSAERAYQRIAEGKTGEIRKTPYQAVQHIAQKSDGKSHDGAASHTSGDKRKKTEPNLQRAGNRNVADGQYDIQRN